MVRRFRPAHHCRERLAQLALVEAPLGACPVPFVRRPVPSAERACPGLLSLSHEAACARARGSAGSRRRHFRCPSPSRVLLFVFAFGLLVSLVLEGTFDTLDTFPVDRLGHF